MQNYYYAVCESLVGYISDYEVPPGWAYTRRKDNSVLVLIKLMCTTYLIAQIMYKM